jgi:hypothetical protein
MAFVIGVAAQAQMGKDTLADFLEEKLSEKGGQWTRDAFASNVKNVFEETFGVDRAFTEKWKVNPDPPPGFDMSVRKSLQFIGDGFRQIKSTIGLDLTVRDSIPKIISDVRYPNEFRRVKREGGLNILVGRPSKLSDDPNGSEALIKPYVEWALNNFDQKFTDVLEALKQHDGLFDWPEDFDMFDAFIRNDGTVEELYETIQTQLVPFVEKFVFKFPKEKEEKCLISS